LWLKLLQLILPFANCQLLLFSVVVKAFAVDFANCHLPIAAFLRPLWLKLLQLVLPIAICHLLLFCVLCG
jgi:hypothetical protein